MPRPEWHVVLEPWEIGCLFFSLPEGPLCTEEHLLLGHFRGGPCVSAAPNPTWAGLVSWPPPTHPVHRSILRGKTDTCTSLEKAPSVVFSTGPLSSPRKENNVWTDNSSKTHDHSCTALAVRWTRHHVLSSGFRPSRLPAHPMETTDILLLQMQKPSKRECRTSRPQASGAGAGSEPGQNWGSIVCQPFTPQMC